MGTSAIELRPIVGASVSGAAAASADDDDDGYRMNNSLEISSLPPPLTSHTLDATVTNKRHVRRKYLSMVLVAVVFTLISPGTILWTSVGALCKLPTSSMIDTMISTSVNTTFSDSNHDNTNYYTYTVGNSTHSTNVRVNCVDATTTTINIPLLMKIMAYAIALIGIFLNLQGSNPGLLDKEILSRLEDDDALVTENVERQSFLEPSLQTTSTSLVDDDNISSSSILYRPQQNHQIRIYCYPHTRRKYCHMCNIHLPLRSHHCHQCKTCVATFDHHCVLLRTCIGERNHFRFWFFALWNVLCFRLALGIVNSGRTAPQLLGEVWDSSIARQIRIDQAILVIAQVYMYPLYFIAGLLLIVHTINALKNVTTFELTKGPEHIDYLINTHMLDFPFGKGVFNNVRIFVMRDDVLSSVWHWSQRLLKRRYYKSNRNQVGHEKETATTCNDDDDASAWVPTLWKLPTSIDRESEDEDY
jgi:hypothetical protein